MSEKDQNILYRTLTQREKCNFNHKRKKMINQEYALSIQNYKVNCLFQNSSSNTSVPH